MDRGALAAALLLVFSVVAGFSIGLLFLPAGLLMSAAAVMTFLSGAEGEPR